MNQSKMKMIKRKKIKSLNFIRLLIAVFLPLTVFIVSRQGWAALASRYRHRGPVPAARMGVVTGAINTTNYKNSLLVRYNGEGLYLRPVFIFRLFHPPLFIPWAEIGTAEEQSAVFGLWKSFPVGEPPVAMITLPEQAFERMRAAVR